MIKNLKNEKGKSMTVGLDFYNLINKYIVSYLEKKDVKISAREATNHIAKKIENSGGLIIE